MDSSATVAVSRFFLESSTARTKVHTKSLVIKLSLPCNQRETTPLLHSHGSSLQSFSKTPQRVPFARSRNCSSFLTRCSTKPDINTNSGKNSKPATEVLVSSSTTPQQPQTTTTPSSQALSSAFSRGLVFDLGPRTSWDSAEIGSPVVKRFIGDNEERWFMWYHGRSLEEASDSIGLAVSSNGIHWERGEEQAKSCGDIAGLVMKCSEKWWAFDTHSVRPSGVVIMSSPMYSSVYWLYYSGYSSSEKVDFGVDRYGNRRRIFKSMPGLACSQDGRHWARIEGDQHSGSLLEVGSRNDWDSLFVASPHAVVHSSDDMRMYYHSFDAEKGHFGIGIARSRDGIRWLKLGKIMGEGTKGCFDELGVKNAYVVRNQREGKYLMAYEGVALDGVLSIGLAVSPDGLKDWERIGSGPILRPSEMACGWDSEGVGSPCMVEMDGEADQWRLYYVGVGKGGRTGIGMAISQGCDVTSFRKWSLHQL